MSSIENIEQLVLTETLALCLSKDYSYTIFRNIFNKKVPKRMASILELQGFKEIVDEERDANIYVVNMSSPCTFTFDVRSMMKEPYRRHQILFA